MNRLHRWYCRSDAWRRTVAGALLPWVLDGVALGDDVLEIGPGPGLTTDVVRMHTARLTSIEIDARLAGALAERLAGTDVTVVHADATRMPFPDGSFSGAVCCTMLHHVPSSALQDRLLAEVHRVLRPGGVFAGSDSRSRAENASTAFPSPSGSRKATRASRSITDPSCPVTPASGANAVPSPDRFSSPSPAVPRR